jgi:hypothetical protein
MYRLLLIITLLALGNGCTPSSINKTSAPIPEPPIPMQITIERISKEQRDQYLTVGGLPGNELNGEIMDNPKEHDGFVDRIVETLEKYGKIGLDDPYYVNLYAPADYFPCVEVKGIEFVSLQLVVDLHAKLLKMPTKYRVDVCSAMPFWNDDLNIFIEYDKIYWFADDDTAKRIGLHGLQTMSASN